MNSLERILATVTGVSADYQPFTMLLSLYGASLIKSNTIDYYRDPELWFEGQRAVVDTFDPDIVISPFSFPIEAEAFGSELVFLNKYVPNIKKPIITNLSQLDNLPTPDFEISKSIQFFLKGTDLLAENYKNTHAIACPIHAPSDLPALLMGIEMWIDTLLFHPEAVDKIMKKTVEHFVKLGNEFIARGATFLVVPVNFTNSMIITDKIFAHLLPYLKDAFSRINGPIVVHNGGCKLMGFIESYATLPNVIALLFEQTESFDEARIRVGNDIVLMGNLDGPNFTNLTVEKAKDLIVKSDLPITQISSIIGFCNVNYFDRIFKKYFGCNPSDIRKKH